MEYRQVFGRRIVGLVAVAGVLLTACGSNGAVVADDATSIGAVDVGETGGGAAAAEAQAEDVPASGTADDTDGADTNTSEGHDSADDGSADDGSGESSPDEPAEAEVAEPPTELVLAAADWDSLVEWNLPALGGLRFGVPPGMVVYHDADMVTIRTEFAVDTGRYDPMMVIALVHRTGSGRPVSVGEFTSSAIAGVGSAAPTNSTLALFGEQLEGWRFTIDEGQGLGPHYLFSAYPDGADGLSAWQPFPHGELYLADVPGGVLAVGWVGQDDDALATARAIFDAVAPTLTLVRPLSETALSVVPLTLNEPQPPPDPAAIPAGWPGVLTGLSKPLDAGDYSLRGFGTALSFTLGEGWWVQPNFPSWLILSGNESFGPGDRSIMFRSGVDQLLPAIRSGDGGDAMTFDPRAMIESPPSNIEIVESEDVELGGAQGVRLQIEFADSADCSTEVCEYMLTTKYPFPPASLRTGYQYEIWHLDQGITDPVTLIVGSSDARWFAHAREVIDSINFDTAS